jgi:transcriptional regulator with XRE-family HTH domain
MAEKNKDSIIAVNLKRLKKDKRLSQSDLCKKTGLAYHTIAKIENGATADPRISSLKKIAEALGVTIDAFFK